MELFWFCALSLLLVAYAVLDGFDLGAGCIHLLVAKTSKDRDSVIKSIGPFWDGNEVCLLAAGGLLVMCFPKAYAAGFSGLYLPLIMVLWLLVGRAIALEFRHLIENPLWHQLWDGVFSVSSLLLTIFFGAALGNIIRGVPLDAEGHFFTPLWTTFFPSEQPGVLDLFTVAFGVASCLILSTHGAHYVAMKSDGELRENCRKTSRLGAILTLGLSVWLGIAIPFVQPYIAERYLSHPIGFVLPLGTAVAFALMLHFGKTNRDTAAFTCSSLFIGLFTASLAFGMFPHLLIATTNPAFSLTTTNTLTGEHSLRAGLIWWPIGVALAIAYFTYNFYIFRGKVSSSMEGY